VTAMHGGASWDGEWWMVLHVWWRGARWWMVVMVGSWWTAWLSAALGNTRPPRLEFGGQ
jgi:hypothetical protein